MKKLGLILLLPLLITIVVLADRRGQLMEQRPKTGLVDPSGSNTLYAWWAASDLPVSGTSLINNTNPWIDRVQSILLRNGGLTDGPTNSTDGVNFVGAGNSYLTNAPLAPNQDSTLCIIFKPHTLSSSFVRALIGPYSLGDAAQSSTPGSVCIKSSSSALRWGGFCGSCVDVSTALTADKTYDLIVLQSGTSLSFITNGVTSSTITRTAPANGWPWYWVGHDSISAADPFDGWVKEVLVWSNAFSAVQTSNVHYYATNTYAYAP